VDEGGNYLEKGKRELRRGGDFEIPVSQNRHPIQNFLTLIDKLGEGMNGKSNEQGRESFAGRSNTSGFLKADL